MVLPQKGSYLKRDPTWPTTRALTPQERRNTRVPSAQPKPHSSLLFRIVNVLNFELILNASNRELMSRFLKVVEPRAVEARKSHRFKRKRYWAAGVNDAWPQDQHDKWMRFGLSFTRVVMLSRVALTGSKCGGQTVTRGS